MSAVPVAVMIPSNVIIEKIACGHSHVLALSTNHQLFVWGGNHSSQLGVPASEDGVADVMQVKSGNNLK